MQVEKERTRQRSEGKGKEVEDGKEGWEKEERWREVENGKEDEDKVGKLKTNLKRKVDDEVEVEEDEVEEGEVEVEGEDVYEDES